MKPKKRVYCVVCHRQKMLFSSEKEANDFIRWNSPDMKKKPTHAYWCAACGGWHITSWKGPAYDNTKYVNNVINDYRKSGGTILKTRSKTSISSQMLSNEQTALVEAMKTQMISVQEARAISSKKEMVRILQEKYTRVNNERLNLMFNLATNEYDEEGRVRRVDMLQNIERKMSELTTRIEEIKSQIE